MPNGDPGVPDWMATSHQELLTVPSRPAGSNSASERSAII